jgi:hypothetical protein
MAYDEARGVSVLYGGADCTQQSCGIPLSDTWEWNGTTWTALAAQGLSARAGHETVYNATLRQTFVYGGFTERGPVTELWSFDGARWTKR